MIGDARSSVNEEDIPFCTRLKTARRYISRLESWLGVPTCLVSVGPERNETILVKNPFRD
jgi:adenylosuccinate synthase